MRCLAITALVLTAPPAARADTLWCGTFGAERGPLGEVVKVPSRPGWVAPVPAAPARRARVVSALVDGAPDAGVGRQLGAGLALERCPDLGEVGRGAWDLELLVGADGTVIDALVRGERRGGGCLNDRVRAIRFGRGAQPRHVSARVIASSR